MKMFRNLNKDDLVPGIEEDKNTTSKPEYKLHVHIIHYEG